MIAVVFPGSAVNEISLKTSSSLSGYLNETFLNSTSPFLLGFNFLGSLLSFIASSVSIISFIRFADTDALGNIIETIDIIKKLITICIVYWINAIIFPTCIVPLSIPCAPTHTINNEIPFIININVGIIKLIALLTKRLVFVKSIFALSNLFSSFFSVLNALITGKPVKISLATRFSLSINCCNFLNLGIAIINNVATTNNIATIATPIIHAIELSLWFNTLKNPPIPIIGAYTRTLNSIAINPWICWISFVERVIKDAVLYSENSLFENLSTFLNTFSLNVFASLAATLADKHIIEIADIIIINDIPSIFNPAIIMYWFCMLSVFIPIALYSFLTSCIAACSNMLSCISSSFWFTVSNIWSSCSFGICLIISIKLIFCNIAFCCSCICDSICFFICSAVSSFSNVLSIIRGLAIKESNSSCSLLLIFLILYKDSFSNAGYFFTNFSYSALSKLSFDISSYDAKILLSSSVNISIFSISDFLITSGATFSIPPFWIPTLTIFDV